MSINSNQLKNVYIGSTLIEKQFIGEKLINEYHNINCVPYISTYYIKPIVEINEDVKINFYITDFYHKEYLNDNFDEKFSVLIKVSGKENIVINDLTAGDHEINIGSFSEVGEKKFSLLCIDSYGRNSHELFNFFLVKEQDIINEYIMTNEDLIKYNIKNTDNYEEKQYIKVDSLTNSVIGTKIEQIANSTIVPSNKYICFIGTTETDSNGNAIMQTTPAKFWLNTIVKYADDYNKDEVLQQSINTRIGLQKLLDDKKQEGYNKVKLLPGIYRIDHKQSIYIPDKFTLDMNNSTLKLNQFVGSSCLMLQINFVFDSHVLNGTIEGDYFSHDYANSPNNSEWALGIGINGASKYCSFENMIVKDITGYGSVNGISTSRDKSMGYTYLYPISIGDKFKLGDINRLTGEFVNSSQRTTSDFINIGDHANVGYLSISKYLGYQGNGCKTWNIICHFYNANKEFIKSIDGYQYRRIEVPVNAQFIKVTILSTVKPTTLSIQYFAVPTHCSFKNIIHNNCRCVGMAPSAMNDMLVENCEWTLCGQSGANCAFDAEDGWDQMQDCTFKSLKFYKNNRNDFLTCAGHNFIIDGQISGSIYIWERTRSLVVKNCKNVNISLQSGGISSIIKHGIYRVYNNHFLSGNVENNLAKNNTCSSSIGGKHKFLTANGIMNNSNYENSIFKINNNFLGYLSSIKMINCQFIPQDSFINNRYSLSFNGGHGNNCYFKDCTFNGKSLLADNNGFYSGKFIDCIFENTSIITGVNANIDDLISFNNCTINYDNTNSFIKYGPFAYSKGTYNNIEFNNCKITNIDNSTKSLFNAYSKPNGKCTFNNCTLNIPAITIFDGYPSNKDYITDYSIIFNNTTLPKNTKLISDYFSDNKNIKILLNN